MSNLKSQVVPDSAKQFIETTQRSISNPAPVCDGGQNAPRRSTALSSTVPANDAHGPHKNVSHANDGHSDCTPAASQNSDSSPTEQGAAHLLCAGGNFAPGAEVNVDAENVAREILSEIIQETLIQDYKKTENILPKDYQNLLQNYHRLLDLSEVLTEELAQKTESLQEAKQVCKNLISEKQKAPNLTKEIEQLVVQKDHLEKSLGEASQKLAALTPIQPVILPRGEIKEQIQHAATKKDNQKLIDLSTSEDEENYAQDEAQAEPRLEERKSNARYFVMKSNSEENLNLAKNNNCWKTQVRNNNTLRQAANNSEVYLMFSVKGSGQFDGLARMSSKPHEGPELKWNKPATISLGPTFAVEWMYKHHLPFYRIHHLKNPLNEMKSVKVGRDGQEVESSVGEAILKIYEEEAPSKKTFRWSKITQVESPSKIHVQNIDDAVRISLLNSGLSSWAKSPKSSVRSETFSEGICCVARQEDRTWGRGEIIELKQDVAIVYFYDNGKIEQIPSGRIKNMPKELQTEPPLASQIHLSNIKPTNGKMKWADTTCEQLKELLEQEDTVKIEYDGELVIDENGINSQPVKIWIGKNIDKGPFSPLQKIEESVATKLIHKGLGIDTRNVESVRKVLRQNSGNIYARHVKNNGTNSSDFVENHVNFLEKLHEKPVPKFVVGQNCVARWAEDLVWYNGRIVKIINSESFSVEFVDYGNTDIVNYLYIVEDGSKLPPTVDRNYVDLNVYL